MYNFVFYFPWTQSRFVPKNKEFANKVNYKKVRKINEKNNCSNLLPTGAVRAGADLHAHLVYIPHNLPTSIDAWKKKRVKLHDPSPTGFLFNEGL